MPIDICPVCREGASECSLEGSPAVECRRCGKFSISKAAALRANTLTPFETANLSGWVREHEGYSIKVDDVERVAKLDPPSVSEKADRFLLFLQKIDPRPGTYFSLEFNLGLNQFVPPSDGRLIRWIKNYDLIPTTWSQDERDLKFLTFDFLCKASHFLEETPDNYFKITPQGWVHINSLKHVTRKSDLAFIGIWFHKSMNPISTIIEDSIIEAGYKPLRIDKHQHNNKIDDEILAAIRRSYFVVCDFTGQRGGVYFEAGFALGLGLPVIWLCENADVDKIHFDNRQYNFILWEKDELEELKRTLQYRIVATIGQGPLKPG